MKIFFTQKYFNVCVIAALFFLLPFFTKGQAPVNDNCSGAVTLTPGSSCTNTAGTLNNASISSVSPTTCVSGNPYDVWYSFTATSSNHTITLSGYGTNFTRRQMIVYRGTCTGFSFVACTGVQTTGTSLALAFNDYSPGTLYYIRVIQASSGLGITTLGNFQICVTTTNVTNSPNLQFGKSYTNVSKPNGGVIQTNDVLEFRYAISVNSGSVYNTTFHDTIQPGMSYIPNSIRFSTNEGLKYQSGITGMVNLTDASGDDEAVFAGNVIRVNTASLTRTGGQLAYQASQALTPITTASAGGGKIRSNGRPSFYGGTCILMVTYQVQVTAATGTIFSTAHGAFRYKITTSSTNDVLNPQTVRHLDKFFIAVSQNNSLCQSSIGLNNYTGGDFGTGTRRHDSTQLTTAPGYNWTPFSSGTPNDGSFAVVNNTSVNLSTNKYQVYQNNTIRVFGWWDIIGDHTNAANQDSGNFAVPYGTNGGYMAVVNAAYGINNAVRRTINGLCTDTYYEFSSWFKNICKGCSCDTSGQGAGSGSFKPYMPVKTLNDSAGVSPDLTFQVDGVDYYTTGSIPYNKMWMKKGFLFRTGPSQSTVTLTIRNNAPGGGGNDWAMDDISLATCLPTLQLRPGNNPSYCLNSQVDLSAIVTSFYPNYTYYEWERSVDGGFSWTTAPEMPGVRTYTYTYDGSNYKDTVSIPSFLAAAVQDGYQYRVKTATSLANLSGNSCSLYNLTEILTMKVFNDCDVLPAEILEFKAQVKNEQSLLNWKVNDESNLHHYVIESSADGKNFKEAGIVNAKGGSFGNDYFFTDPEVLTGRRYYRIKLVANGNSTYKYSSVLNLTLHQSGLFEITNTINPFLSKVSFQLSAPRTEEVELQLLDVAGSVITQKKITAQKGINSVLLETPSSLVRGTYLIRIQTSTGYLHKMIQRN
jgi:trimeric autotransporter adhesin